MSRAFIWFSRHPYEDTIEEFLVRASNGVVTAEQSFYEAPEAIGGFAERLIHYPFGGADEVRFERGEPSNKWAYYIMLRAFRFDSAGHSALTVIFDNSRNHPNRMAAQFSIRVDSAELNEFGRRLAWWWQHPDEPLLQEFGDV